MYPKQNNRDIIAYVSPHMINNVDLKNPFIIAWWSAAFPGYGHLILGNYLIGLILIAHEIVINTLSGINTAIYYSLIGEFMKAKQSLDLHWVLAYLPPYFFAIWDSYQRTTRLNEDYIIAYQKGYEIIFRNISALGLNRLDRKKPIFAVLWSFLAPGLGHLYINRIPVVIIVPWLIIVMYFSNLLPAIHYLMVGNLELTRNIIDPQWVLYLPSIYGFMAYDAYVHTVEYNKLYKMYHKSFLKSNYQNKDYQMPILY